MKLTKNDFFGYMLMLVIFIFSPFYVFASGMPQPAHIIMLIASVAIIFINHKYCVSILKANKSLIAFLAVVFSVNFFYFFEYKKIIFIIKSMYWLYGFIMFLSVLCVFDNKWLGSWIKKFIILQLCFISISYLVGWGGYAFWPRYDYFFNGPSQLGYFSLSSFIIYLALSRGKLTIDFLAVYFLTGFSILMTGSRSCLLAFIPLILLLVYFEKGNYKKQLILISVPIFIYIFFYFLRLPWHNPNQEISYLLKQGDDVGTFAFSRLAELCSQCSTSETYSIEHQMQARGFFRVLDFPQYLLFGAGQGMDERFCNFNEIAYEIHSSILGVLFYYGLPGLAFFLSAVYKAFKNKINILLLSPLFVYGLFTFGLRSPYFFLTLGFVALIPNFFDSNAKYR